MLEVTTVTINKSGQKKEIQAVINHDQIVLMEPTQAGPYKGTTYVLLSTGHHRFVVEDIINQN
jgi:hypothetical protein